MDDPAELLDYLAERIPGAHVKHGHLSRGPITEAAFEVEGRTMRARWSDSVPQPNRAASTWLVPSSIRVSGGTGVWPRIGIQLGSALAA